MAQGAETRVAVAADFTEAAEAIAKRFHESTGHAVILSSGATGKLYQQIVEGAAFDVFVAADVARPEQVIIDGFAVPGSRITYAIGRIALWSAVPVVAETGHILITGNFKSIAIADPKTAPYGAAAVEAMKYAGVYDALAPKIVEGANIAAAYKLVASGKAEVGFVALSEIYRRQGGSRWVPPQDFYRPIRQQAVLLKKGVGNPAAEAFMAFLGSGDAREIIHGYGYATQSPP